MEGTHVQVTTNIYFFGFRRIGNLIYNPIIFGSNFEYSGVRKIGKMEYIILWLNHFQQFQDSEHIFDALINVKFHLYGYTSVSQAKNSRGVKVMNVKLSKCKVMNVSVTIPQNS